MAHHVDLSALSWTQGGHPLEQKKVGDDPKVILLRFEPGFADPSWCERSHVLYVLRGALHVELESGAVEILAGQSLRLAHGERHRAANRGAVPTELLAVSDLTGE
jgi:mannose-6-phosphate isomerase-like protein (cupin superfamily)